MAKMVAILLVSLLGLTVAGQEAFQMLPLHDTPLLYPTSSQIAISVSATDLPAVASGVWGAETWLRAHVLDHYPSTNISAIVIGNTFCNGFHKVPLVLSAAEFLRRSLRRWASGIKVAPAFAADCFASPDFHYIEPLIQFTLTSGGSYAIITSSVQLSQSDASTLVVSHGVFVRYMGHFRLPEFLVLTPPRPAMRKLTSSDSQLVEPYPARPTPLSPLRSSIGVPNPVSPSSHGSAISSAMSPSSGMVTQPPESFDFAPPVEVAPANSPVVMVDPPACIAAAPPPAVVVEEKGLWCVAKPSVPSENLQEAMDYACGEGGADCEKIMPHGSCYLPNTDVAHASYAFNSYWQKNKNNGGTCNFGGTAMVINSDPSFRHCRFIVL